MRSLLVVVGFCCLLSYAEAAACTEENYAAVKYKYDYKTGSWNFSADAWSNIELQRWGEDYFKNLRGGRTGIVGKKLSKFRPQESVGVSPLKVKDIVLVGSHDAGCIGTPSDYGYTAGVAAADICTTSHLSITSQLCRGSRWFDLRFRRKIQNGAVVPGANFRIHHGPTVDSHFGCYYQTAAEIGVAFKDFISDHPDETLFLRIKVHLHEANVKDGADQFVKEFFDDDGLAYLYVKGESEHLADLTLDQVRGKIVIIAYDTKTLSPIPEFVKKYTFLYTSDQWGDFGSAVQYSDVISKQKDNYQGWLNGDIPEKRSKDKLKTFPTYDTTFGLWYTSTEKVNLLQVPIVARNTLAMRNASNGLIGAWSDLYGSHFQMVQNAVVLGTYELKLVPSATISDLEPLAKDIFNLKRVANFLLIDFIELQPDALIVAVIESLTEAIRQCYERRTDAKYTNFVDEVSFFLYDLTTAARIETTGVMKPLYTNALLKYGPKKKVVVFTKEKLKEKIQASNLLESNHSFSPSAALKIRQLVAKVLQSESEEFP